MDFDFVFICISILAPQVVKLYTETYNLIPTNDYLLLANEKEKTGEYESAITYLERCNQRTQNKVLQEQIAKKIPDLQQKLANKVMNGQDTQFSH
jgi:hypothetical protein